MQTFPNAKRIIIAIDRAITQWIAYRCFAIFIFNFFKISSAQVNADNNKNDTIDTTVIEKIMYASFKIKIKKLQKELLLLLMGQLLKLQKLIILTTMTCKDYSETKPGANDNEEK